MTRDLALPAARDPWHPLIQARSNPHEALACRGSRLLSNPPKEHDLFFLSCNILGAQKQKSK